MLKLIIVIEGGVVQEVRGSNGQAIEVDILDLGDTEDTETALEKVEEEYPYILL